MRKLIDEFVCLPVRAALVGLLLCAATATAAVELKPLTGEPITGELISLSDKEVVMKVDGKAVDTKKIPHTLGSTTQWDETFDVGSDTGTPVDDKDYKCPFTFTGKLNKLTVKLGPMQLFPQEKEALKKKVGQRD